MFRFDLIVIIFPESYHPPFEEILLLQIGFNLSDKSQQNMPLMDL